MKNDKSQFVVRTSDFYLSLVIGHLPFDPRLVAKDFSSRNLRALGALRGFAVNPGLHFHREGAKHAKKTRRTLVWLRLCRAVFIYVHTRSGSRLRNFFTPSPYEGVIACSVETCLFLRLRTSARMNSASWVVKLSPNCEMLMMSSRPHFPAMIPVGE